MARILIGVESREKIPFVRDGSSKSVTYPVRPNGLIESGNNVIRRRDGLWEATAVGYEDASACRLGLD